MKKVNTKYPISLEGLMLLGKTKVVLQVDKVLAQAKNQKRCVTWPTKEGKIM